MTRNPVLVCRTRRQWRAAARVLRTRRPEIAAKITLARLADLTADIDEPLTIAFSPPEYERLVRDTPDGQGRSRAEDEWARTVADIEAFLGLPTTRRQVRPEK
jgi:hypothetical protein